MTDQLQKVMRDARLSTGARLLYWELTQWVTDDLTVCYPTQHALADNLGVHRVSIIRWLQELRAIGLVQNRGRKAYVLGARDERGSD